MYGAALLTVNTLPIGSIGVMCGAVDIDDRVLLAPVLHIRWMIHIGVRFEHLALEPAA
jgi:hypothetical protein